MTEANICKYWEENNVFKQSVENHKENQSYNYYDGPPFATGPFHRTSHRTRGSLLPHPACVGVPSPVPRCLHRASANGPSPPGKGRSRPRESSPPAAARFPV